MSKGRSVVISNGFVCVSAWSKGQMGRSVVNSSASVVSKRRSVVNSCVCYAFALSKAGNVVNSNVFMCFCMAEGRTCRQVSCFCVFLLGQGGKCRKVFVFVCFLGKVEKCCGFVCFLFLCVFAWSKWENVEKCRVCRNVLCFCMFSG